MAKARPGQRARLWAALGGPARLLTGRRPFDTPGEVEASDLRLSQRRPSVPGDMDALPRLVQAGLAHTRMHHAQPQPTCHAQPGHTHHPPTCMHGHAACDAQAELLTLTRLTLTLTL